MNLFLYCWWATKTEKWEKKKMNLFCSCHEYIKLRGEIDSSVEWREEELTAYIVAKSVVWL